MRRSACAVKTTVVVLQPQTCPKGGDHPEGTKCDIGLVSRYDGCRLVLMSEVLGRVMSEGAA
jgi:hypothetical protein